MIRRHFTMPVLCRNAGGAVALTLRCAATFAYMSVLSGHAQAAPREHVVTMGNMTYGRLPANVKVGDIIIWENRDTVPHTVTARDKSFDLRVPQGKSARMIVKKAGTTPIYCIYHPMMRGTLKAATQ